MVPVLNGFRIEAQVAAISMNWLTIIVSMTLTTILLRRRMKAGADDSF